MATNINQTLEDLIDALEACCEEGAGRGVVGGQQIDDPPSDGTVVYGEGEDYPDAESYFNAKCSAANGIYDTIVGTVDWLRDNNVDLKAGVLGSITTALILALTLAGPVGWAMQLSGVVITVLAGFIVKSVIDFIDMLDGLDDVHEELVLALYNASSAETARDNFLTIFNGATPSPSTIELTLTRLLLPGSVLNQLFTPRPDVGSYESPDPIDCGASLLAVWSWPADYQSWTYTDLSVSGHSATRTHSVPKGAIKMTFDVIDFPGGPVGEHVSPVISIAVTPGASVQLDYSETSDAPSTSTKYIEVTYTDDSVEWTLVRNSTAGTLLLTLTQSKTIKKVLIEGLRLWDWEEQTSNHFEYYYEVRIFGAA